MARAFRAMLALVTAAAAAAHAGRAGYDVAVTPTHVFIVGYTKFETSAPATIAFEGGQLNNLKIKTKTKSSSDDEDREEGRRDTTAAPSTNTAPANVAGAGARAPEVAAQVNTCASALSEAREASSQDNSSSYKVPSGADELLAIKELIYQHNFLTNVTVGTKAVSKDENLHGIGEDSGEAATGALTGDALLDPGPSSEEVRKPATASAMTNYPGPTKSSDTNNYHKTKIKVSSSAAVADACLTCKSEGASSGAASSSSDNSSSYKVSLGADELLAIKELIYQHNFLTNVTVGTKVVSRDVDSGGRGRGVAVISGTEIQKGGTCITPVARTTPRAGKPGSGVVSNRLTAGAGGAASATVSACAVVYSPAWG